MHEAIKQQPPKYDPVFPLQRKTYLRIAAIIFMLLFFFLHDFVNEPVFLIMLVYTWLMKVFDASALK